MEGIQLLLQESPFNPSWAFCFGKTSLPAEKLQSLGFLRCMSKHSSFFPEHILWNLKHFSKRRELQRERDDGLMQKLILYRQKAEPRAIFEVSPTMHTDLPDETKPSHQIRLWRYLRLKLGCSTPTYLLNISGSIVELIFFSFPFLEIIFWLLENCSRNWFPFTYFLCKYLLLGRSRKNSSSLQVMCRKDKIFIKRILDKPFKHK